MSVVVSDIDGVLASFESAWAPLLAKLAGEDKLGKDWPGPQIWDWDLAAYGKKVVAAAWDEVRQSPKFWTTLDPIVPWDVGRQFNRIQCKHDVFFLTSRIGLGVQNQTCKWLYDKLGINYPNVIVVNRYQDKWALLDSLNAGFFVDDKLETVTGWYDHYLRKWDIIPDNCYFNLIDQPYNREGRPTNMRVAANITEALKEARLWT